MILCNPVFLHPSSLFCFVFPPISLCDDRKLICGYPIYPSRWWMYSTHLPNFLARFGLHWPRVLPRQHPRYCHKPSPHGHRWHRLRIHPRRHRRFHQHQRQRKSLLKLFRGIRLMSILALHLHLPLQQLHPPGLMDQLLIIQILTLDLPSNGDSSKIVLLNPT